MGDEGPVFSKEDIEAAIGNCNFNKAIGIDWFSGKVMKKNNDKTPIIKINLISQKWKFNNDELIKGLRKLWESHILNLFHTYFPNLLPISLQLHLYTFLFL